MVLLTYGGRIAEMWWQQNGSKLAGLANLTVIDVPAESSATLASLASRTMRLSVTIQDGSVWLADDAGNHELPLRRLQGGGHNRPNDHVGIESERRCGFSGGACNSGTRAGYGRVFQITPINMRAFRE